MFFSLVHCPVPKSHLVSLSWWVDAKGPEQRFRAEREALSVLAAEHCEASIYAEHWGILAGGDRVGFVCRPQLRVIWIPKGKC